VVDGLTKCFGSKRAVDGLTFTVGAGTITGFLGPNGAGKTTTIRCLLGLTVPTSGTATICGRAYRLLPDPATVAGALLEDAGYHTGRSARSHLQALALAAGIPRSRVDEVLEFTGLGSAAAQRVRGFSAGMRRRLGLAGALLGGPRVLILDEPASGLDPDGVRWLRDMLRRFADRGGTVLVSSHLLDEVAHIADDVVIIRGGRLAASAPLRELVAGAEGAAIARTATQSGAAQLAELIRAQGVRASLVEPGRLRVIGRPAGWVGSLAATHAIALEELGTEQQRLEDVFMELTKEAS